MNWPLEFAEPLKASSVIAMAEIEQEGCVVLLDHSSMITGQGVWMLGG